MDKLDKIIAQLDELELSQKHKEEQIKHNQNSLLLRLPKVILIQRLCAFLDDLDLYRFTATCSSLRNIMFCPLGFKLLSLSRNAQHIVGGTKQQQQQQILLQEKQEIGSSGHLSGNSSVFDSEEDVLAQLHALKSVKEFLTTKLQSSQAQIQNLEDLIADSSDTLKYEKSVNLKLQSKINILQNQLSISELQRQDVKENLSELNSKYNKIISSMEQDRALLQDENDKLLGHKKVLIQEVYKLRGMISQMETDQNIYQSTLKQVRAFMDTIDLKPI
ncbi:unnamed protein product (macronuclear) [Paramecium tetraurelia]|uniref:F-box domain-containing protein n=1 Tax=Paramecium tetraurelia TaxID=5888 RepID=A0DHY7_PARTE|nr:uncharacterized protein GSPATT00017025001 [Paramecium tetraurelia]CAK82654.1 unnamed protein product [Paramecium tetraurelia]|eukprot:XP_001450051.1 hypothetical protein (macronuclear) [Paramecium tetraurelia strain d4-2]